MDRPVRAQSEDAPTEEAEDRRGAAPSLVSPTRGGTEAPSATPSQKHRASPDGSDWNGHDSRTDDMRVSSKSHETCGDNDAFTLRDYDHKAERFEFRAREEAVDRGLLRLYDGRTLKRSGVSFSTDEP